MTPLRLLLNSPFTGANLFFALGAADGSFRAAGLDLQMTPGRGAWTAAGRLAQGEFDLAYGDVNALVQCAAHAPDADLPRAVCVLHQRAPSVVCVPRGSGIRSGADLAGRRIAGHASDVALQTFPVFARAQGVDPQRITIETSELPMAGILREMLDGRHDAAFGYSTTHTAALAGLGLAVRDSVRFLHYRDACPALYGSALMASGRLVREQPGLLRTLVQIVLAKLEQARAQPESAMAALRSLAPDTDAVVEAQRWQGTLAGDMALDALPRAHWGCFDTERFARGIADLVRCCGWSSVPAVERLVSPDALAA